MQTRLFTYFSEDTFKKVRKGFKDSEYSELQRKVEYLRNQVRGYKAYITQLKNEKTINAGFTDKPHNDKTRID